MFNNASQTPLSGAANGADHPVDVPLNAHLNPHLDPPLIAIVGETASGKSALALQIAEQFGGEIICADSWTVYRGFDIGTAKPSAADRARVRHHLLDVADPQEGYNAVRFQAAAQSAIADITSRNRLPIMVGGTGLYMDCVLYNYEFLPPTAKSVRDELNKLSLELLLEKVDAMGLDTAGIDLRNKRRIVRHIENAGVRPTKHALRGNTLVLGLHIERENLQANVTARVDAMLAAGLEREVRRLLHGTVRAQHKNARSAGEHAALPPLDWTNEPMKGIGYREWQAFFAAEAAGRVVDMDDKNDPASLAAVRERIIKGTMDLAKRQRTWFKRNNDIQWVDDRSNAVDIVTTFLNKAN